MGDTFASRVAASQLTALGLAEMIVDSDATYFEKALYLGNHPDAAQALKTQLEQKRDLAPLFNTQQYVKDLESLYRQVLQD
jgi:predicted O-linked N-acetylglucosamine transferase (SPINDLY family)